MLTCSQVQAALSARLDGEPSGYDDDVVDAHLSGCPECQEFFDRAATLSRMLTFQDATDGYDLQAPDLSQVILAEVEPVRRRQAARVALRALAVRILLALLGALYVGWAVALLTGVVALASGGLPSGTLLASDDPVVAGLLFDAAAFRIAMAFGLFYAAWRPNSAAGLFPVFGGLFMFSLGFGMRDLVLGYATASDLFGIGLMFLTATVVLVAWITTLQQGTIDRLIRSVTATPQTEI